MLSRYRGERYKAAAAPDLVGFVEEDGLHALDYEQTLEFYVEASKVATDGDWAYLGCVDRFFLFTHILGRHDGFHPWLFDRCREVELEPDYHLDLWSREHFKSSLITYAGSVQEILNDPEITIGIFSHTKGIATKFVAQIKREFEANPHLRQLYPDICWIKPQSEAPSWSTDAFTIRRRSNPKEATVEGHGLVDGQPTSRHFKLRVYDDVVTRESVTTPEQVKKTTEAWELSDNLGSGEGRFWMIGTRYCSIGSMRILMSDWSHRPISEVNIGDEVVGWEIRDGARYLRRSRVVNKGRHPAQPVNRYTLENGRSVTCTADHNWWRGPHGGGPEYAPLGLSPHVRKDRPFKGKKCNGKLVALRELLTPVDPDPGRDAGWLAGFFDGEGTMKLNTGKNRVSGVPCLVQSMANPELIDEVRSVLSRLGFHWSENWHAPSKVKAAPSKPAINQADWKDRCVFNINGGWRERYRFLAQVAPTKRKRLEESLFARLSTERVKLAEVEPAGLQDVYWLETETGNYVIEGFCSSNSFGDSYGDILDRGIVTPRIYPATDNGKPDGNPVFLTKAEWEKKKRTQRSTLAAQMLQNPLSGKERTFLPQWFKPWYVRPATMNVYILADPSRGRTATSDRTAIAAIGLDAQGNKYLVDGFCHRMKLSQRWDALKHLHKKWSKMPGVGIVRVGYERFGQQSDDEYFIERMRIEKYVFAIEELAWPREGQASKQHRVERLQPDVEYGDFLMPGLVHVQGVGECLWSADEEAAQIVTRKLEGEMQVMKAARDRGQGYLNCKALTRKDEEGQVYDLTRMLMDEMLYFPFATHDDLVDAASRIYDIEAVAPSVNDEIPEMAVAADE